MAEDLLKKYTFAVDSVKATNGKPMAVAFSQGDVKTAILIINLTENDTALDLTGKKVRVSFKKSDGTSVMQDMTTGISVVDALAGKIQIELSTQTLSARGNVRGQISITDEVAGLVAETAEFTFVVRESIINTSIVSSDELPIIEEMIEAKAILAEVDLQTVVNNTQNVNSLKSEVEKARDGKASLKANFDEVKTQLAQNMKFTEQFIDSLGFIKQDGSVIIIGDSITEGYGLSYSEQYVSKLYKIIKEANGFVNDFEVITNFQAEHTIQVAGTYSIGTKGASKKSLRLQPNATITFTGNVQYIDLIFDKTPTSGSIEVYRDGILYKTINCSGTANPFAHSFPSESSDYAQVATYTLKCVNSQVEILGIIRLQNKSYRGGINLVRCGVTGENTTYFSDDTTLEYIKHISDYAIGNRNKLYILGLGTNDIYNNSGKAISSVQYQSNLEKIILALSSSTDDVRIVLTVPPVSNDWVEIMEQHVKYRTAALTLANKYNLSIIDYSTLFFTENNWYQDGVHPNAEGTTQMVNHIMKSLSAGINNGQIADIEKNLAQNIKKTSHIVNVADFGAVGDGTNETSKIQAAIDYVFNLGGGEVQFNNATYRAQGISPKGNVKLKGTGGSTIKLVDGATNHLIYYNNVLTLSHFDMYNLTLDGNSQILYDVVHINEPSPLAPKKTWYMSVVDNCDIKNGKTGIYCPVPGSVKVINSYINYHDIGLQQLQEHFYLTNTVIWGNRIGADIGNANHFNWHNAVIAHNTEIGIKSSELAGKSSFENGFIGCSFIDNPICWKGKTQYNRFVGCRFLDSGNGLMGISQSTVITSCEFTNMSVAAITFDTTILPANNVISSNVFQGNLEDIIVNGNDFNIQGNSFLNTKRIAIRTYDNVTYFGLNIQNNNFVDSGNELENTYPCIQINAGLNVSNLSGNVFRNTGSGKASHAIWQKTGIAMSEVLMIGNTSRNMKTAGYQVRATVTQANNIGSVVSV